MNKFFDLETLQKDVLELSNSLFLLTQKMNEDNLNENGQNKYLKVFILKIASASKSLLKLSESTKLNVNNTTAEIIDYPSVLLLARGILENYLTMEYLYFNEIDNNEKDFRFKLWRMSGFMLRQNSLKDIPQYEDILSREKIEIENAKMDIKNSIYYSQIKKNDTWKLDAFGIPRVLSWIKLIELSQLKTKSFKDIYQLYSNYAHSEFLSMMQLYNFGYNSNSEMVVEMSKSTYIVSNSVISHCFKNLITFIDYVDETSLNLDEKAKSRIDYWYNYSKK